MRPIDKQGVPLDAAGNPITVNNYDLWRKLLIDRIGYYCVYCNIPLNHSLQVEHVVPKDPPPGYTPGDALAWDNMLLACGPCNRAKWNTPINFADYYFPDRNNTLLPFTAIDHQTNSEAAIVSVAPGLQAHQQIRAVATIGLMKLDNVNPKPNIVDIRFLKRKQAFIAVELQYKIYKHAEVSGSTQIKEIAESVARCAQGHGFFGIWLRKFAGENEAMKALLDPQIIPGTADSCFDPAIGYSLKHRNPTNIAVRYKPLTHVKAPT